MTFRAYLAKRLIIAIFILWVVATINFLLFIIYPADPTHYLLDPEMTEEQQQRILELYGFNDPLHIRYLKYLQNMFSFGILPPHFGWSPTMHDWVASQMAWRMTFTVTLLGSALILNILIGVPLGIYAASKRGRPQDTAVMALGLFTWGFPTFFIQLLTILALVYINVQYGIRLFPTGGWVSVNPPTDPLGYAADVVWHMIVPIFTLVVAGFASWALYTRNLMLDALTQDYVLTARAKGLKERDVLWKHAFKSIRPPIATMITLSIPGVVTGAIITETIFGLEGIGKWYINALNRANPDYVIAQAVLFVFAALVILCNFIADILYGFLDPRIRVGARR
ncbi:ABC transporter permease [Candidatus Bathyarchaeota archaeon]|nr:MAG: ABC transporter permease [Candidatus Bathyarchaeota archaeon]